jgi:transposase
VAGEKEQNRRRVSARLVEDEEYQLRYERACGIDVAKASGMVCTRLPPERDGGRRVALLEEVEATVPAITGLAGRLLDAGVEMVSMESTSDYWRVWFYVLEAHGLRVQLVSSSQARQLAGRPKSDALDAQWIARLTEMGLLRPSFVPPAEIRELRDYTRARLHKVQDRAREWNQLEKLLEGALIKLSSVASSLQTKSALDMIAALIDGERNPAALAGLARRRMKSKRDELERALTGVFDGHHAELARMLLDTIDYLDRQVARLDDAIAACLDKIPAARGADADGAILPASTDARDAAVLPAAARLAEIPGVSENLARAIIAEIGLDMSRFPTPGHLVSWAGLAPVTAQSGTRAKSKKGHGDTYARNAATQAANGAVKTQTFLGERYNRLARRRGKARALVAVARSILIIVWHLLKDPTARFTDLGWDYHARKVDKDKKLRSHLAQIQALGYQVTITPAA